ncbi:uncharacterized protein LOC142345391 [Convolutriloba macropyga]|uniref:uncharacterized protein LOC142345391 n=1 Tax=Convolutriloba macropyga TaxID=536237 RepID=UPI003F5287DF
MIKYNYAVQGREECLYQLFRAWQGEAKFWLFNLRVVITYLLKNNRHKTIHLIFDHPDMHFYTKWINLEELAAAVVTTSNTQRLPSLSWKLGLKSDAFSAEPVKASHVGGEQERRVGEDSSASVSKSRVSSMETQNMPQMD